jgi:hypothetical protein
LRIKVIGTASFATADSFHGFPLKSSRDDRDLSFAHFVIESPDIDISPASLDGIGEEFVSGCHSADADPLGRSQFATAVHRQLIFMRDAPLRTAHCLPTAGRHSRSGVGAVTLLESG